MCQEKIVNCQDFENAINSLSYIFDVDSESLLKKLRQIEIQDVYKDATSGDEFHFFMCKEMNLTPREIKKLCGSTSQNL